MLITLLAGAALAQEPVGADGLILRPAIDSQRTLFTEDALVPETGLPTLRVTGGFAFNPTEISGSESDEFTTVLSGGYAFSGVRLGADVPIIGTTGFGSVDGEFGIGDLGIDGKVALIEYEGLAAAVNGKVFLPTSTVDGYGRDGVAWRAGAIGEFRSGPFLAAGNIGFEGGPGYFIRGNEVDTELYGNLALGYAPEDFGGGVALELVGWTDLDEPFADSATSPAELVATGWYPIAEDWSLNAGVGVGLNNGYGASDGRLLLGVTYTPGGEDAVPSTVIGMNEAQRAR